MTILSGLLDHQWDEIKRQAVVAAQCVYDEWQQDAEGFDEEYGGGGICDDVASAIVDALTVTGVEAGTWHIEDENHTVALALLSDGVYVVDIPFHLYERGGTYSYRKIPNVTLHTSDVTIERISKDPAKFQELMES